jgi:hypothetical protein
MICEGGGKLAHRYDVGGLTIWSEIILTGFRMSGAESHRPDVTVVVDTVQPPAFPYPHAARNEGFEICVPGIARFVVRDAREIVVQPVADASWEDVGLFLRGPVLGALWHQRGFLPLHASAVQIGKGGCVAFMGDSFAGKSTTAAIIGQHGYPVLADDVCPVRVTAMGAELLPACSRLKLRPDAARTLCELSDETWRGPMASGRSLTLHAVYQLRDAPDGRPPRIDEHTGLEALKLLMDNVYRREYADAMNRLRNVFLLCAGLRPSVRVCTLTRPRSFDRNEELIRLLAADWMGSLPVKRGRS